MPLVFGEVVVVIALVLVVYGVLYLFGRKTLAKGIKRTADEIKADDDYLKKLFKKRKL